jgi:nitrate reductase gamma subunit
MEVMFPKPWALFWFFAVCCFLYLAYSLYHMWKGWSRGMKTSSFVKVLRTVPLKIWVSEVFLQRQLFSLSFPRWMIHQCIFWGFIALTLLTMVSVMLLLLNLTTLDAGLHEFFSRGAGRRLIKIWGDIFGFVLSAGCAGALARRFMLRPVQIVHDHTDMFLTVYLLFMTLSGFMLEGLRMTVSPSDLDRYAFIGRLFMPSHFGIVSDTGMWFAWTWIIHAFSGAAILVYLPHSKLLHSLLAPLVIAMNASEEQGRKDMYWPKTRQYRPTK